MVPSLTVSDHTKFDKTLQALAEKCEMFEKRFVRFEKYDQNNSISICATKHFEEIGDVNYHVVNSYQEFLQTIPS